jgi:hypothetical protein
MSFNYKQVEFEINNFDKTFENAINEYNHLANEKYPLYELKYFKCPTAYEINDIKKQIQELIYTYDSQWLYTKIIAPTIIAKPETGETVVNVEFDYKHETYTNADLTFTCNYTIHAYDGSIIKQDTIIQDGNNIFEIVLPNRVNIYGGDITLVCYANDDIGRFSPIAKKVIPIISTNTPTYDINITLTDKSFRLFESGYFEFEIVGDISDTDTLVLLNVAIDNPFIHYTYNVDKIAFNKLKVRVDVTYSTVTPNNLVFYFTFKLPDNNTVTIDKVLTLLTMPNYDIQVWTYTSGLTYDKYYSKLISNHDNESNACDINGVERLVSNNILFDTDSFRLYNYGDWLLLDINDKSINIDLPNQIHKTYGSIYEIAYYEIDDKLLIACKTNNPQIFACLIDKSTTSITKTYDIVLDDELDLHINNIGYHYNKFIITGIDTDGSKKPFIIVLDESGYDVRYLPDNHIANAINLYAINTTGEVFRYDIDNDRLLQTSTRIPTISSLMDFYSTNIDYNIVITNNGNDIYLFNKDMSLLNHCNQSSYIYAYIQFNDKYGQVLGISSGAVTKILTYRNYEGLLFTFTCHK